MADLNATKPATSNDDHRKIFVGNLPFNVDDEALASYFGAVGNIVNAHVIRRGRRSLGYGFVTYETEQLAVAAHQSLNKQTFNDREINVELAKPHQEGEGRARRGGFRGRGRRQFGYGGDNQGGYYSGYSRGGFRGRRGGRAYSSRVEGTPSKSTLFVANLPFSMKDDDLRTLFGKFKVATARIVMLRSGRSKGFGFVEFETEAEQQRALIEMNNAVVDERPLTVKVAMDPPVTSEPSV